jgi:Domain of unknown function (DUF4191)
MARSKSSDSPDTPAKPKKASRTAQIRQAYSMTRKSDPRVGWIVLGAFLGAIVVLAGIGLLIGHPIYLGIMGVMFGVLAATVVFGKRAEKAAFSQVEGQPGAAAAALNMLRKGWTVTPGVAVTRNQDLVHRAVGRPGVVLIAEGGGSSRLGNLLAQEKKKVARFVPDVPIYDIQAGNDDGQIPLRKLNKHMMKLPRNLKNDQVIEVNRRLKALGTMNLPIPKGPMPRNIPRGGPRG